MKRLIRCFVAAVVMATVILVFSIGVLSAHLPRAVGKPDVHVVRTFSLAAAAAARLRNQNGEVRVRVHDAASIRLDAAITGYTGEAVDVDCVDGLIEVVENDQRLDIISHEAPRMFTDLRIDYTLLVPPGTDVSVASTNGNVWISKGCGNVTVEGANTDIEVVEPRGGVHARSTNGRIRLIDAPAHATLHTVNGNIYAHMLGGALDASTTNGAIVARVLGTDVEKMSLKSHNGGLTLVLHNHASAVVEAVTSNGAITCDWPVVASENELPHRLRGTIGAGHTEAHMETLNGNIWIAKEST